MSTVTKVESIQNEVMSNNLKRSSETLELNETDAKRQCPEFERVKRKKLALLLAYSGQGYLGLQRNPNRKTIEGDLLDALRKCNLITDEIYNQPQLIQFQRAARTDKGVSALRQVLSLKLPMTATVEEINKHLPDQIRVIALKRATKGFNSKTNCDARTYAYMLPTFTFAKTDSERNENYRIAQYIIDQIRIIISHFQGTHNFHNFTSRKRATDPSAKRYMISLNCSDPFIVDNIEFATIYVKETGFRLVICGRKNILMMNNSQKPVSAEGQSFMLHQIRKMVGLTIAIVRGLTTESTIHRAFDAPKLDIPIAPSAGLLLEEVHYQRYNKRYGSDGMHESLEWSEYDETIEEFKKTYVLPGVITAEKTNNSMLSWLETLPLHTFDIRTQSSDDEISDADDDDTPMMDGLIALKRAALFVEEEERSNKNESLDNLDTLAKAATQALNGDNTKRVETNNTNKDETR